MKKEKDSHIKAFDEKIYEETNRIEESNIAELNTQNMMIYGANINLARVFPEIHDGLKLGERRILYAMKFLAKADKKHVKSHTVVGQTLMIHAHGDASVYQTMVRLAQMWNMIIPYVNGKGNFGTAAGDDPAASRYTEVMLSDYALDCFFSDWNSDIVLMEDTYNRDLKEPIYMPTKYPNCLMSSSDGMGFGSATHIPTYNLEEVLQATIRLIKEPKYEPVLIPDITTGCLVVDEGKFEEISKTGRGTFKMRAEIIKNEEDKCIIIKSIPFQVSLVDTKLKIKELVEAKVLPGFKDMKDYSAKKIHLELYFRPEVDLDNVISILYRKTKLQSTYPVQLKFVDDFAVVDFSIKSCLLRWIDIRTQFKRKSFINKLVKLEQRNHILKVLIYILDGKNAEKTISIIKNSTKNEIVDKLVKTYNITTLQAREISNMRLSAFNKTARQEYIDELEANEKDIKKYDKIVKSPTAINTIIIKELEEGIKKYSAPRRSKVVKLTEIHKYSDFDCKLIFTKGGYVKKIKSDTKGIGTIGNTDEPIDLKILNNRDEIVLFDKRGSIHTFDVGAIASDDLTSIGSKLSSYISIAGNPVSIFNRNEISDNDIFIFVTKNGIIKKTEANNFAFKNSIIAITLKPDDELVKVIKIKKEIDIVAFSRYGFGLRFNTSEIPISKRLAIGVIAFPLSEGDEVVGVKEIGSKDKFLVAITDRGLVKKCTLDVLSSKKRRSAPVSIMPVNIKDRLLDLLICNNKDTITVIMAKKGLYTINVAELPELLKCHDGEQIIPLNKTDLIIKVHK